VLLQRPHVVLLLFYVGLESDVAKEVYEEEITNLEAVIELLEERGEDATPVRGALSHFRMTLAAQFNDGSAGGYGGYGASTQESSSGTPPLAELKERARIVRKAVEDHRSAGEDDHAAAAEEVLQELQQEITAREREL